MTPSLSVLLTVGVQRTRGERCLAALLGQSAVDRIEVVLVDVAPEAGPVRGSDSPRVRLIPFGAPSSYAAARAESVRHARAPYLAFVEDHVVPEPGWAAAVLSAFERGVAIVNYAFTNQNPETYVSRATLVGEYGPWMTPARSGPVRYLSGNNIAYAQSALAPHRDDLDELFETEFLLQKKILAEGGSAWLESGAVVAHETWVRLGDALRSNGSLKHLIGGTRARQRGWGPGRRVLFAAGMVLSPGLHIVRLLRGSAGHPENWVRTAGALPILLPIYVYGAYREALGYLFGEGRSRESFLVAELFDGRDR